MYDKHQFEKVCSGYIDRLAYVVFLCNIYKSRLINGKSKREKLKIAPSFFDVSFKAIKHQALLTSANFYLFGQSNEFTIHKLLKILESDSNLRRTSSLNELDDTVKKIRDSLGRNENLISRLIEWRNRYISHNDKKYFNDKSKLDSEAIDIDKLTQLLETSIEQILNVAKTIGIEPEFDKDKYVNDFPELYKRI